MKYQLYRSLFILGAGALMALLAFAGQSGFGEDILIPESHISKVEGAEINSQVRDGVASVHNAL